MSHAESVEQDRLRSRGFEAVRDVDIAYRSWAAPAALWRSRGAAVTAGELTQAVELLAVQRTAAAAVERWGDEKQLRQTQEECAELIAAINRYERGREGARENMLEEAGQVFIMLMQVREIVGHDAFADAVRAAEAKTRAKVESR